MTKTLLGYFWRGCLVLAPVSITLYIAWLVFTTIDRILPVGVPGVGFVLTLVLITLVGFLTSNVIGKAVVRETEKWLARVPLVKLLYTSIRDLVGAFVGDKKKFDRPVAVAIVPGSKTRALGFVTRESLAQIEMRDCLAVYFPQSYNFAGNVLVVPKDQVETLSANSTDVMAFIVSGGVSGLGIEPAPLSTRAGKS
ncbi:MAG: DUF502 domain-containing protein [Polyangiaceae bacterium]|nr:DUF502 domain-containing protein [Polyangiaceae bacterium]